MSKTINDLRETLFATLEGVKAGTIDLDKARAINDIARSITETAKVEVDYLRTTGGGESSFIDTAIEADNLPEGLPNGITGITRHRLQG
jgi:hypothetical protein